MRKKIYLVIILCVFAFSFITDDPVIKEDDLILLTGKKWTGTLTYLDYSSKKEVSIPVDLTVTQSSEYKNSFILKYEYTDEPDANGSDTVLISDDGKYLGDKKITSRSDLLNNTLGIITEESGEDDNRPAMFRHIYLISDSIFSIKKEVKFNDESEYFKRNVYEFKRAD